MDEKKSAIIRDWVEPAHPMVVRFHDDLLAIYRRIRDKFLERIDKTFDATSREIGFLVTTTLPLTLEIDKKGKVKQIELGAEYLKNTLFDKHFSPILRAIASEDPEFDPSISPGTYNLYLIWFDALKLKLRTDWVEPAHFRDYFRIRERFADIFRLRFDWVEPAHIALGGSALAAVDPDVMEPAHFKPSPDPWRDRVLIAVIDEIYPELHLVERITRLKDLLRTRVQPDVMDPEKLKRSYGDRLTFFGTVGTAQLWAWGAPGQIRAEVRERIETVGKGGGLIISPAYDLEPAEGIPWANVLAFFEAVDEFGVY